MEITFVDKPKTSPPDPNKPYMCVAGPDGTEQWLLLGTDAGDGVTDADFDFEATKRKLAQ
jgi:hypothetical protein